MNVSGRWDRHKIDDLGRKLGMIERAVGYRQPLRADGYQIMRQIFTCDDAGLTRRLNGSIQVTDFELSRIIHVFGLDLHGVHPDHLLLEAEEFDAVLKRMGAGIYGASEFLRFAAAARRFEGAEAQIEIRHVQRGPGFGPDEPEVGDAALDLRVGHRVRFRCTASVDGWLLLIDHRVDAQEPPHLLSPAASGKWVEARSGIPCDVPGNGTPQFHVHPAAGERRVTAIWVEPSFGREVEGGIEHHAFAHRTAAPKRGTAGYRVKEERDPDAGAGDFRQVSVIQLSRLTRAMEHDDGTILAVAGRDYRIIE